VLVEFERTCFDCSQGYLYIYTLTHSRHMTHNTRAHAQHTRTHGCARANTHAHVYTQTHTRTHTPLQLNEAKSNTQKAIEEALARLSTRLESRHRASFAAAQAAAAVKLEEMTCDRYLFCFLLLHASTPSFHSHACFCLAQLSPNQQRSVQCSCGHRILDVLVSLSLLHAHFFFLCALRSDKRTRASGMARQQISQQCRMSWRL